MADSVYSVHYFYHATGMEMPDRRFVGKFTAGSASEAIELALAQETRQYGYEQKTADFIRGCLSAAIVFPRPRTRNNKTAVSITAPMTLRELRLWHWFKAQAFRKSEAQFKSQITGDNNHRYYTNQANQRAKVAEWHEAAVKALDPVVPGAALDDAMLKGYTP